jgi:predicted dinucleotide-binding enzyme
MTAAPVVAIIGGSGQLGRGLSLRLAGAGVPLIVGSRNEATAEQAAGQLMEAVPGARVRGLLNVEAVAHAELVVLAVPFAHQKIMHNAHG